MICSGAVATLRGFIPGERRRDLQTLPSRGKISQGLHREAPVRDPPQAWTASAYHSGILPCFPPLSSSCAVLPSSRTLGKEGL